MIQRLSRWAQATYAEDSMPTPATLRKWAEKGVVPGAYKDANGRWYVDTTACKAAEIAAQRLLLCLKSTKGCLIESS